MTQQFKISKATLSQFVKKVQAMTDEQKRRMLDEDAKISAWVKAHPDEEITADKVNEILSTKIDAPSHQILAHLGSAGEESAKKAPPEASRTAAETAKAEPAKPATHEAPLVKPEQKIDNDYGFKEAKEKLAEEKKGEAGSPILPTAAPSIEPAKPAAPAAEKQPDTELARRVEVAFRAEIDDFYGKKGLFTHTEGVDTPEWKFMGGLPAAKVADYYNSDSSNSNLDPLVIKELTESNKHQQFLKQMNDLMNQAKGAVRPYQSETIEQFFKRLGNYVMRQTASA